MATSCAVSIIDIHDVEIAAWEGYVPRVDEYVRLPNQLLRPVREVVYRLTESASGYKIVTAFVRVGDQAKP